MKQATAEHPAEEEVTVLRLVLNSKAVQVTTLLALLGGGGVFVAGRTASEHTPAAMPSASPVAYHDPAEGSVRVGILESKTQAIDQRLDSMDKKLDILLLRIPPKDMRER